METVDTTPKKQTKVASRRRNHAILIVAVSVLALAIIGVILYLTLRGAGIIFPPPSVTIETPGKLSAAMREPFSLELRLSSLGDASYPASSFSISFDPVKLEFLGIEEGNVLIESTESGSGTALPEWSVNVERSNATGVINIMYLDMTGGKYAFSRSLLREEGNILLLLKFRLRGSVTRGDVLGLTIDDAVFAAVDESYSLASAAGTLRTNDARIVIGE